MNPQPAANLISQTFSSPFDEQQFQTFTGNLLNEIDRDKAFASRHGSYIPQAFQDHIRQYKRPFVYYDPDGTRLDVLIVRLHKATALERARTMQRNFAAWYLKQAHDETVDAALVAFYQDDAPDWRFSFVRLEYAFGEEGVEEKLTPARRYSFLVGPNEPAHTAQEQLLPFLIEDGANPKLDKLEAAFQIETVSKQFFEAYKELFLQLVEAIETTLKKDKRLAADFQRTAIELPSFAKKLLGQIVFLYFVQKKGWLGVTPGAAWGTGPKDFLRRLFDKTEGVVYSNFFDDVLEPLFYEALALQREDDLFTLGGCTCQIPFLNGGLFEPMGGYDWQHTNLLLPNTLFSNRKDAQDDGGTGILDVFDRYNFTVWEEEPLEKEVAVDPEMLGKVFENLLDVQDRKSKGAFYTPREIVHYMCQESLINYLDTSVQYRPNLREVESKNLQEETSSNLPEVELTRDDIAVLVRQGALALQQDAAKEAGLQKGEYVLPLAVREQAAALDAALAGIKLCDPAIGSGAFPVGMLHEIVQARLALGTYLSDSHFPGNSEFPGKSRTPYNLKRHAIQESIYGVDIDAGAVEIAKLRLWLSLVVDEENYEDIQPLPNLDYKIVCGNSLQSVQKGLDLFTNALYVKLHQLKMAFFNETHRYQKRTLKAQIDLLLEQLTGGKDQFDYNVYFREVFEGENGGFDVIIGNPPYVRQELLRDQKPMFKQNFPDVYAGTADIYVYFYRRGTEMLRQGGTLAYITSNKFMRAGYGKKLRAYLTDQTTLSAVIDFGDLPVFDATAYPSIVITQKKKAMPEHQTTALTVNDLTVLPRLPMTVKGLGWPMPQTALKTDGWALVKPDVLALMQKLRRAGIPLEKYVDGHFYRGIVTGYNEAFVIDAATREKLIIADPRNGTIIKPWLRGKDIRRYKPSPNEQFLLYIPWGFPIKDYPTVYKFLKRYKDNLAKRPEVKEGRFEWFALSRYGSQYVEGFEQPKIIYPHFNVSPNFTYDVNGSFSNDKTYIIPNADLFLLGILNSRVSNFYLRQICPSVRGNYMELRTIYVGQIPIPQGNNDNYVAMEKIVQQLLDTITNDSDQNAWEIKLNQLVYQLYNLTPDEISLIEASIKG